MKSVEAWLPLFLLLILTSYSAAQAPQPQPKKGAAKVPAILTGQPLKEDPKDDELRKLLKARYNAALTEAAGHFDMYRNGRGAYEPVADARRRLLLAGLDLCDTPAHKVALLKQFVEQAKADEKFAKFRLDMAKGTTLPIHRARYERLDAEIQLLRAKREADRASGQ